MKIATFGIWSLVTKKHICIDNHIVIRLPKEFTPYYGTTDYIARRRNGTKEDERVIVYPIDGTYTWIKGKVIGDFIFGEKNEDGFYEYEVHYEAGSGDKRYFLKIDKKYLSRIEREGHLQELEPAIWYLRRGITGDIGEWWEKLMQLPNVDEILKKAELEYKSSIQPINDPQIIPFPSVSQQSSSCPSPSSCCCEEYYSPIVSPTTMPLITMAETKTKLKEDYTSEYLSLRMSLIDKAIKDAEITGEIMVKVS